MLDQLVQLPPVYELLFLILAAIILWSSARFWWKIRQAEQDLAFKKELLQQNYSIADIERLVQRGRSPVPLWMIPFPAAPGAGQPQSCPGVARPETAAPPETAPPAAGAAPPGWMSFGAWYGQRFAGIPLVFQALLWLLYGYLWIPLWYRATRPPGSPAALAQVRPISVFPAFVGAAFFVAVLFPSISVLVYVSSSDAQRPRPQPRGDALVPERWVVPVEAGQEGACRIAISHEHFAHGGDLAVTAVVIAQSNPAGKMLVETKPDRVYVYHGSAGSILVKLNATAGTGDFTVQVNAVDRLNQRGSTIFTVQVRSPADDESPF